MKLYNYLNQRLRLSITFKITMIYALVLTALLFVIGVALSAFFSTNMLSGENSEPFGVFVAKLVLIFVLVILVSIVIGFYTTRKLLRPIGHMIAAVKSIKVGALHTRLNVVDSYDELKELAETFNEMLDRIQAAYEQQNRFVADASHELRAPISVIQGYANLLHRWGKEDRQVMEESLEAIKSEGDSMKILVENLLFLARTDKNDQQIEKMIFPLNELLDEVIKETKLIAVHHPVVNHANEIIILHGDKGLIKQALRIFVDNSIKYTPPGKKISIDSRQVDKHVSVTIEDEGIGISAVDLPHIFERFYKCDKSRNRDSQSTGLGLSIAKWIVEKHEGSIKVESKLDKGTKITLTLPIHWQS